MRKFAIKTVLFSLSSLAPLSAQAGDRPEDLRLIEELPIEQRVLVHKHVLNYFNRFPHEAANAKVIAIDGKGTVYVLDEKLESKTDVGQPSCVGGG